MSDDRVSRDQAAINRQRQLFQQKLNGPVAYLDAVNQWIESMQSHHNDLHLAQSDVIPLLECRIGVAWAVANHSEIRGLMTPEVVADSEAILDRYEHLVDAVVAHLATTGWFSVAGCVCGGEGQIVLNPSIPAAYKRQP